MAVLQWASVSRKVETASAIRNFCPARTLHIYIQQIKSLTYPKVQCFLPSKDAQVIISAHLFPSLFSLTHRSTWYLFKSDQNPIMIKSMITTWHISWPSVLSNGIDNQIFWPELKFSTFVALYNSPEFEKLSRKKKLMKLMNILRRRTRTRVCSGINSTSLEIQKNFL